MRAVFESVKGRGLAVWQDRHGLYILTKALPGEVLDDPEGLYIWGGRYDPEVDAYDKLANPTSYCLTLDDVLGRKVKGKRLIRIVDPEFGEVLKARGVRVREPLPVDADAPTRAKGMRQLNALSQLDGDAVASVVTELDWTDEALDDLGNALDAIRVAYAQALSVWRADDPEVADARGVAKDAETDVACLRDARKASDALRSSIKRAIQC